MGEVRMHRTVHVIVPWTGRPLCGYEEDQSRLAEDAPVVACQECSALLKSGVLARARESHGSDPRG